MKNVNYQFYSVLKNEDATPFVGNNLLIVADGLGGSGSTVHNIEQVNDLSLHDEIFASSFYDFDWAKAEGLKSYLEHWVYHMADGIPDTSALWASRIAIARCAYALCCDERFINADLSDGEVRRSLSGFISEGLQCTAEYFRLEKGRYDDQKLLPTTLAFIRYGADKGRIVAEVVWAGDSRCYFLTPGGLKLMTRDDEDGSGSITNLFFVGGKKPAALNYAKYVIQPPCALMAVSDGIFDPFEPHENFGMENLLLGQIESCNSYEELMEGLKESYGKIHSDDATMAFASIGFEDYRDMQRTFAARGKYISYMWQKLREADCTLEAANTSEDDVRGYVEARTRDKFSSVITSLVSSPEDIACTDKIKSAVAEAAKSKKSSRAQAALGKLFSDLSGRYEECLSGCLADLRPLDLSHGLKNVVEDALKCSAEVMRAAQKSNGAAAFGEAKKSWRKVIAERERYYWESFDMLRGDGGEGQERFKAAKNLRIWTYIDHAFEHGYKPYNYNELEYPDKQTARQIEEFIVNNKQYFFGATKIRTDLKSAANAYARSLERLFGILQKDPSVCTELFNEQTVAKYGFNLPEEETPTKKVDTERVISILSSDKQATVSGIVDALAENYAKTSVIDTCYNATRLNSFREYYKLLSHPDEDVRALEEELNKLKREYLACLK